jgi:hypothetical protein
MRKKLYWIAPLAIVAMVLFTILGGEAVKYLWNWLLPPLFGWRMIGFWQALGLLVLCRILFGGFGARGMGRSNFRRRMWDRWDQRWQSMTPEEREKARETFRESMRGRCGFGGPAESASPGAARS